MDTWTPPVTVGIVTQANDEALFQRLGLEMTNSRPPTSWALTRSNRQDTPLTLVRHDGVCLCVDFNSGKALHRTTENGKGIQALAKALGIRHYHQSSATYPHIIDATGGLGQDAWAIASLGCTLQIIEAHPLVHALLEDALQRAAADEQTADIAARISLNHGDAAELLPVVSAQIKAHAIYLDPMYPARRKRAASKKGMQFLQTLLEPAGMTDDPALLLSALACGVRRVAVKRPKGAELLAGSERFDGQRTTIETPNTRYDVYHST